uniref:protein shisa-5-like n=1 Tax=Semicossyphus pulcher TaxID=241346 RepID=UPI0037E853A8
MASGLSGVVVLAVCVYLAPCVSGSEDCAAYRDISDTYHSYQKCSFYCCGTCFNRYCCHDSFWRLTEDKQEDCDSQYVHYNSSLPMIFGVGCSVVIVLIVICCCVCPCCCLHKMCRKPRPVIATTTHTTVVTSTPQQYPQQPTASHGHPQAYQGTQYQPYQSVPVQPGYGSQPMPQGYGAQPMAPSTYHGQPFTPGPPPTYQEATGPCYPPNPMPYSQAAFSPNQPPYPPQPPVQPQPNAPARPDYLDQPAYNPDYVASPP